jgi:hypothetical protein
MHERVFEEGGAARAAAVATCARVFMRVVGLVGGMGLRSRDAHRLRWRSHLEDYANNVVGLRLDLVMVATRGALTGLTVGVTVGTLRIGAYGCMNCVICLFSSVGGMGMLPGPFTHGIVACCKMVWSDGFFESVGIYLYACLCCINNIL